MVCSAVWRRLRGLLVVLLIVGFAGAPGLDRLICVDEPAATAESIIAERVADAGQAPDSHDHEPCHHGHCHHGAVFVPSLAVSAAAPEPKRQAHLLILVAGGPSDRQFGLMRPPRA